MEQKPALLRRLLRPRPSGPVDAPRPELAVALTRAAMRGVSAGTGLTTQAGDVSLARTSIAEAPDRLPDDGFTGLLSPVGGGAETGLIALDGALFSALVEVTTLGRLSARRPEARRPTPTDLALLGVVIDRLLVELHDEMQQTAEASPPPASAGTSGWRLARGVNDLRLLPVLMEDGAYDLARLSVTLDSGQIQRSGTLVLLLPVVRPAAPPARTEAAIDPLRAKGSTAPAGGEGEVPVADFQTQVLAAPARLEAVLGRVVLPLSAVMALGRGDRLELPLSRLEEVELVSLDGRVQALARLGQTRGLRALRVVSMNEPACRVATRPLPEGADPAQGFIAAVSAAPRTQTDA